MEKDSNQLIEELTATNKELRNKMEELEAYIEDLEARERRRQRKPKRAYSPCEVMKMTRPTFTFDGDWQKTMGYPATSGTWIIWGMPGNGKSSFIMQLAKYLCKFDRVIYDSLEESTGRSLQMSIERHRMEEVNKRFLILDREPMDKLLERLQKKRSPGIVIIDSFQYSGLTYNGYKDMKESLPGKLLIFISHAEGMRPEGRAAKKVEYDADIKILVSGFRATAKSRFMNAPGVPYTIWEEGAVRAGLESAVNNE